jgi:CRISPR-associated protein Cas2
LVVKIILFVGYYTKLHEEITESHKESLRGSLCFFAQLCDIAFHPLSLNRYMKPLNFNGEDLFVVVTYDVHRTRCAKVMKYFRQWLEHRQRSVFSGFLTRSQVKTMERGLSGLINPQYDSIIIFQSNRANQITEWTTSAADNLRLKSVIASREGLDPDMLTKAERNRKVKK